METKRLKALIKLGCKVAIYVPSTINVDTELVTEEYVIETAHRLATLFGGATSTPAVGYWESMDKGTVKERVTAVYSYCTTKQLDSHIDEVIDYCEALKIRLSQEAVSLEVNGELYFI